MTKDEYEDFALRYKGCGACFPMYHTLSRFEKMWFSAIQKDVAELEKENAERKAEIENDRDLPAIAYMQGAEKQKRKDEEQLTKAKKIIKTLLRLWSDVMTEETVEALIAEAEQFISEVEK